MTPEERKESARKAAESRWKREKPADLIPIFASDSATFDREA